MVIIIVQTMKQSLLLDAVYEQAKKGVILLLCVWFPVHLLDRAPSRKTNSI